VPHEALTHLNCLQSDHRKLLSGLGAQQSFQRHWTNPHEWPELAALCRMVRCLTVSPVTFFIHADQALAQQAFTVLLTPAVAG